jgi:ATP-dependent exoDNAse (exonuclease V) alpha subunit
MAIFYLEVKTFGRARGKEGSSATSAAAYRSGERIHDERTGRTHDHSQRQDVLHKEIVVPSRYTDSDMSWAQDRATLWNAAETAEARKDARVAREYVVGLPVELTPEQRLKLVRGFSQTISDRYRNAVDIAIHAPRPESDPRNYHAHLLTTTREISPDGMGLKTTLDISSTSRQMRGLEPVGNEYLWVRERWASAANEALREAGLDIRVDDRGYREQGLSHGAMPRIPAVAREIERRGERSFVAERIREQWQNDAQAHQEKSSAMSTSRESGPPSAHPVVETRDLEQIRREARENWIRMRQQQRGASAAAENPELRNDRGTDQDLGF